MFEKTTQKLIKEAADAGLELLGPAKSNHYKGGLTPPKNKEEKKKQARANSSYRHYKFTGCGHKQDLKTGSNKRNCCAG